MRFILITLFFLYMHVRDLEGFPLSKRPPVSGTDFTKVAEDSFKRLKEETWKIPNLESQRVFPSDERGLPLRMFDRDGRPSKLAEYPTDLNATKLRERLVDGFDPQFMSETRPTQAWRQNSGDAFEDRHVFESFKQESGLEAVVGPLLGDKTGRIVENRSQVEDIDFWLWKLTRCTVQVFWRDFGVKVWPRYVNMGKCPEKPTCSIPKGMKCRPGKTKTINLLYWFCPAAKMSSVMAKRCFWSSFQTEVIEQCRCSC